MKNDLLAAIPARYGSTRFPGKPLAMVAGVPMLVRAYRQAEQVLAKLGPAVSGAVVVATDDERIARFAADWHLSCVMTPGACATGSDRVWAAAAAMGRRPDLLLNWQGDNPCCPPEFAAALVRELLSDADVQVATPAARLRWAELDALREAKKTTPFSGTFAVLGQTKPASPPRLPAAAPGGLSAHVLSEPAAGGVGQIRARGDALYFSKREIPALRGETRLRAAAHGLGDASEGVAGGRDSQRDGEAFSPLLRHIGLYAYRHEALSRFAAWPAGALEAGEGLEQLRFLENGMPVRVLVLDDGGRAPPHGVDSPRDIALAERWLDG